jgi:amino-acid N-acetyltransferase
VLWADVLRLMELRPRVGEVMSMRVTIQRATVEDIPDILHLLVDNALPLDGLLEHIGTASVARLNGRLVGCAALELYRDGALLRSVAVDRAFQGHGIGKRLTESSMEAAHHHEASSIYLLTTTAERFFGRFGFQVVSRAEVPLSVQASVEFRSACPASATVMRKGW